MAAMRDSTAANATAGRAMGAWYRVIKKINGRRYAYLQRTFREGKHVRTENEYLGPVDGPQGHQERRVKAGEGGRHLRPPDRLPRGPQRP